jgi:hypothetical protein
MYILSALCVFIQGDKPPASSDSGLSGWVLFVLIAAAVLYVTGRALDIYSEIKKEKEQKGRIDTLEKRAEDEPEKVRFAWDLARVKLETYFDRNLAQVRTIFYIAVIVMIVGFAFVLWGLRIAVMNPDQVKVAMIASVSGVITQFIGLTFMLIYKSTMLQATQFMSVLERINTVGMAVQILDAMGEEATGLKDTTRVEIIKLLLAQPATNSAFLWNSPR